MRVVASAVCQCSWLVARVGSIYKASVLISLHLGSSLSVAQFARCGSAVSVFDFDASRFLVQDVLHAQLRCRLRASSVSVQSIRLSSSMLGSPFPLLDFLHWAVRLSVFALFRGCVLAPALWVFACRIIYKAWVIVSCIRCLAHFVRCWLRLRPSWISPVWVVQCRCVVLRDAVSAVFGFGFLAYRQFGVFAQLRSLWQLLCRRVRHGSFCIFYGSHVLDFLHLGSSMSVCAVIRDVVALRSALCVFGD